MKVEASSLPSGSRTKYPQDRHFFNAGTSESRVRHVEVVDGGGQVVINGHDPDGDESRIFKLIFQMSGTRFGLVHHILLSWEVAQVEA